MIKSNSGTRSERKQPKFTPISQFFQYFSPFKCTIQKCRRPTGGNFAKYPSPCPFAPIYICGEYKKEKRNKRTFTEPRFPAFANIGTNETDSLSAFRENNNAGSLQREQGGCATDEIKETGA
jgi:hypothetical protein